MWLADSSAESAQPCIVHTSTASAAEAERIAASLVEERLAACCTVIPGIQSLYRWKGALQRETEHMLLIKSDLRLFPALERRIRELHSYDVPEILAVRVAAATEDYIAWMRDSLRETGSQDNPT
ncbi:MAG: divalent-cation tolerance protein CutA [Ignavibacteria bacterium]|nr:divalent-cation tolerance protein CutA [Ignavibacteria bacterium]